MVAKWWIWCGFKWWIYVGHVVTIESSVAEMWWRCGCLVVAKVVEK